MLTIKITEFALYSEADFYTYLTIEKESSFKIIYPKFGCKPLNSDDEISNQYYLIAWAGQQLAEISQQFGYFVPSPFLENDFYFVIQTRKLKQLAFVLYHTKRMITTRLEEDFRKYEQQAIDFFARANKDEVICRTQGLYAIASCYLKEYIIHLLDNDDTETIL
jgi:hypothetical protein